MSLSSCGARDVLLYYPNLIGYFRVILTATSFYYALTDWKFSMMAYALSFVCDYFDGLVARSFNQCSSFGAVLDMVTDRCSTAGLLFILSHLYPRKMHLFLFLMTLDIASHWLHMYADKKGAHKVIDANTGNPIMRLYYGCYPFFGYCCVGTELSYILLYILAFEQPSFKVLSTTVALEDIYYFVCLPACIMKTFINMVQLCTAAVAVAQDDYESKNK